MRNRHRYHYVYYSYEEWGRGYIGSRSCNCLPTNDVLYLGSFKDKSFKPTKKIILDLFETRQEALRAEILLHEFYNVGINSHFANKAKLTSTGFNTFGMQYSKESKQKMSRAQKNRSSRSKETRQKMSEALRGRKRKPFSAETREKMSKAQKERKRQPHSEKTIQKMIETRNRSKNANYGKSWFTNGINNVIAFEAPEGYYRGRVLKPKC